MAKWGRCLKCREIGDLTKHHVIRKQWWKRTRFRGVYRRVTVDVCRECHNDLDKLVLKMEREKGITCDNYVDHEQDFWGVVIDFFKAA